MTDIYRSFLIDVYGISDTHELQTKIDMGDVAFVSYGGWLESQLQEAKEKHKADLTELKEMALAYEEADECDYCEEGPYEGMRPDEIAGEMVRKLKQLESE